MSLINFSTILSWVIASGYTMVFIAMIIGGPIFISAAAFAAALGYFNVYVIFALTLFGEMAVDIVLFLIGSLSRETIVERFGHYFGLTTKRILKLEELVVKHTWKTLFIIKYSPIIPMPGFVAAGAAKLPFKKFFYVLLVLSLPKAIFFTLMGYYFGMAYNVFSKYFYYGQYGIVLVVIIFIAVNYLFVRLSRKISRNEI
ncbi:MAG: VTT domain-containing protein [Patescibacteria group bacterium]|nr:VTT domain-containing protein [Patescibacteria group bacterium]